MFEATAACDKYTSSVLHTAKLIVFHLTKPKRGLLSLLILQEDLPMQEKFCHFFKLVVQRLVLGGSPSLRMGNSVQWDH